MEPQYKYEVTLTTYCDDKYLVITCINCYDNGNYIVRNTVWSCRMTLPNHNFDGSTISLHII